MCPSHSIVSMLTELSRLGVCGGVTFKWHQTYDRASLLSGNVSSWSVNRDAEAIPTGVFRRVRKIAEKRLLASPYLSVRMEQLGPDCTDFHDV